MRNIVVKLLSPSPFSSSSLVLIMKSRKITCGQNYTSAGRTWKEEGTIRGGCSICEVQTSNSTQVSWESS
jgi:hypothetical protein